MQSKAASYDASDVTFVGLREALTHRAEALRLWQHAATEAPLQAHIGQKPAVMPVSKDSQSLQVL